MSLTPKPPRQLSEEQQSAILKQMLELSRKLNGEGMPIREVGAEVGKLRERLVREALTKGEAE